MKKRIVAFALALGGLGTWMMAEDRRPAPYVAHEWGTFTSMQGSDGATLDGLHHEEEGLPDFVYSRGEIRDCPLREFGYKGLETDVTNVTEKMETPVIYFYAKAPLRVRVRVCFNQGILSQWYPVCDRLGPPEGSPADGPLDLAKVEKSYLEWDLNVLPPGDGVDEIPHVAAGDPWAFARLPDSNVLRTEGRRAPRMGPTEQEKFVFYRGLGRFTMPIAARTAPGLRLTLDNGGDEAIRHLFVLEVRDGKGRFVYRPEVAAKGTLEIDELAREKELPLEDMIAQLLPALRGKLVAEGLYESEAEAMVRTWEQSYFHTEGLRVLYVVPKGAVNRILPIAFDPAPTELVRVLVGRLECITPEVEQEVELALKNCRSGDETLRRAAQARLDRLGRFLEPHVRRVLAITTDADARRNGAEILAAVTRPGGDAVAPQRGKKERQK